MRKLWNVEDKTMDVVAKEPFPLLCLSGQACSAEGLAGAQWGVGRKAMASSGLPGHCLSTDPGD